MVRIVSHRRFILKCIWSTGLASAEVPACKESKLLQRKYQALKSACSPMKLIAIACNFNAVTCWLVLLKKIYPENYPSRQQSSQNSKTRSKWDEQLDKRLAQDLKKRMIASRWEHVLESQPLAYIKCRYLRTFRHFSRPTSLAGHHNEGYSLI
jgi:hypothetical protein